VILQGRVESLYDHFRQEVFPQICDVLFTQASYDMGHLSLLE
jgi:hypothetical protein